jgi:ADP-heptose:LPS heptosyltransferase
MKILLVNPFGIGDVLFTTPLIRSLKERGYSIYYWCNERVVDILKYNKALEGIFALSRGDLKKVFKISTKDGIRKMLDLVRRLKRESFDIVLDFSLDYRYSLLLRLLGVRKLIGFDYRGRGRFLTKSIKINGFSNRHIVEHYAELLSFVDSTIKSYEKLELFIGDNDEKWANKFLEQNSINSNEISIGVLPGGGGSWGDSAFRKQWPKEKFAYVAKELADKDGYKILIFGSKSEADIGKFINEKVGENSIDTCGITELGQFAALLKRCKLLLTNDGGPLHMASALGVKTVSIFGPVDEKVYGPYPSSPEHITITSDIDCRPCYKGFKYPLCSNRLCLDNIEASVVLSAIRSNLRC